MIIIKLYIAICYKLMLTCIHASTSLTPKLGNLNITL